MIIAGIFEPVRAFINQIFATFANIRFFDIIDICLVAMIVYNAVKFFRDTRAKQLVKGIIVLFLIWVAAQWFDFITIKWMLTKVLDYGIIALAIIFQPELRRALERMGHSKIGLFGRGQNKDRESQLKCIDSVCKSVAEMQDKRIGALIVFERNTPLGEIINTGIIVDAEASPELISNIFFPKSPLHDGALIVRDGKLMSAGCILPLTSNDDLSKELGTRHRAAVGVSENSDAVVVVVSEETGTISIAMNGKINRNYSVLELKEELYNVSEGNEETSSIIGKFIKKYNFKNSGKEESNNE